MQKAICLPLMLQIEAAFTYQQKAICLPLMPRRAATFAITKMQKAICLPLMPRQAVTFANHGKSNQKRFGTRRQNLSAHVQCTATTISLKTAPNSPALGQWHCFAALHATARHTPIAR
jgi:hypothetical protein